MARQLEDAIASLASPLPALPRAAGAAAPSRPSWPTSPPRTTRPAVVTRADGDRYLLVEFGPNVLDLALRLRVHALEAQLRAMAPAGHR